MTTLRVWLSKVAGFLRGRRREAEFADEVQVHLSPSCASGLAPDATFEQAAAAISAVVLARSAVASPSFALGIGVPGALGVAMLLRGVVVHAGEASYVILAATALLLTLVALAATVIPARRAARVDPLTALRAE